MENTLYQKVKATFNDMPLGKEFTSYDILDKIDGCNSVIILSRYIGSIRKAEAAVRINKRNPAIYKKVAQFRVEPRKGRMERAKEREFNPFEVGEAIITYIKKLEKANGKKNRRVSALKHKVEKLVKENKELSAKLELSRKNVVVNRKAGGKSIRLSLNVGRMES